MRTRISLTVGLALTALVIGIVMSRSPTVVAGTNGVPIEGTIRAMTSPGEACQEHELLPHGTTAIRVSMEALSGPRVSVRVSRGGSLVTSGEQGSGWTRQNVTIPVRSLPRTASPVSVCFRLAPNDETVDLDGGPTVHPLIATGGAAASRTVGASAGGPSGAVYLAPLARPEMAALRIEYLHPGARTWWSQAAQVARRIGLGRAPSGTWIVLAVLVAMATLVVVVSWLLVRREP
jgi:hypothetical protein